MVCIGTERGRNHQGKNLKPGREAWQQQFPDKDDYSTEEQGVVNLAGLAGIGQEEKILLATDSPKSKLANQGLAKTDIRVAC